MCGVFNHANVVLGSQGKEGVHFARMSCKMDGHNGTSFGCDRGFNVAHVDVERVRRHIHQHGLGLQIGDDLAGRRKGHRGHDHFIAFPNPDSLQSQV